MEALLQIDIRLEALRTWLGQHFFLGRPFSLAPASADASFRRYFRVTCENKTWVAMDAPPTQEDCRPFIAVAKLMLAAQLNVPQVLDQDLDQGFLLLSDLGKTTYLSALSSQPPEKLFSDATRALIQWQLASRPQSLPPYHRDLLLREMDLFPHWYIGKHLNISLNPTEVEALNCVFETLILSALEQPYVFVHRDFMPRNLMVCEDNPGILDFQDAVYGPITYDVVSLYRDAFVSWPEEFELDGVIRYWQQAKKAHLPVNPDFSAFWREWEWMGLQRHLKVLGIFARINYRDGKSHYLADTPRFMTYAKKVCARYRELTPLAQILDRLENVFVIKDLPAP
jgi:hypothetical protein